MDSRCSPRWEDPIALGRDVIVSGDRLTVEESADDLHVFANRPVMVVGVGTAEHEELFLASGRLRRCAHGACANQLDIRLYAQSPAGSRGVGKKPRRAHQRRKTIRPKYPEPLNA